GRGRDRQARHVKNPCDDPVHQSECVPSMAMTTSEKHQELEVRLDDTLTRIAMETLEIKHLEQQLTEGQILVNEALQADLRGIIRGIQDYVSQAQDEAHCLGLQNQALQRQLEATQLHCKQLETEARTHREQFYSGPDQLLEAVAEVLSRKRERHADQRIRWTTQQLRAISDTLEQLEPQEACDSATGPSAGIADSQEPLCAGPAAPACNLPEHTELIDGLEEQRKRLDKERKMLRLKAQRLGSTSQQNRCVQKQLVLSQSALEGLDHRLEESATCLLETKQQLWETEEELQQVRRRSGRRR
ncbi:hypothetical protein CRUP_029689, partial [Coryphaenoides rupestris]